MRSGYIALKFVENQLAVWCFFVKLMEMRIPLDRRRRGRQLIGTTEKATCGLSINSKFTANVLGAKNGEKRVAICFFRFCLFLKKIISEKVKGELKKSEARTNPSLGTYQSCIAHVPQPYPEVSNLLILFNILVCTLL